MKPRKDTQHSMQRRSAAHDYGAPGLYHITLRGSQALPMPLSHLVAAADGSVATALTALGDMVEAELLHGITAHYPMAAIDTYVVMPDHLHFILAVHAPLHTADGHPAHLGQVVAGFKYGCNSRYWAWLDSLAPVAPVAPAGSAGGKRTSAGGSKRPTLFAPGYCDVIPFSQEQLDRQRAYILDNPRSRLLRTTHRALLTTQRAAIPTALTAAALRRYLRRECAASQATDEVLAAIEARLLFIPPAGKAVLAAEPPVTICCDSYGDRRLLQAPRLLPVVCHRRDARRHDEQRRRCLDAGAHGAVLVSPRIAKGEQAIIDEAILHGMPVVLVADNGFPERYHPSTERQALCADSRLLLVSPWHYAYRRKDDPIDVVFCKTLNGVAQALCRTADEWWKQPIVTTNNP